MTRCIKNQFNIAVVVFVDDIYLTCIKRTFFDCFKFNGVESYRIWFTHIHKSNETKPGKMFRKKEKIACRTEELAAQLPKIKTNRAPSSYWIELNCNFCGCFWTLISYIRKTVRPIFIKTSVLFWQPWMGWMRWIYFVALI